MRIIKEKRKLLGLTLDTLGTELKISRKRISKFENEDGDLGFNETVSLCKRLGFRVTISDERSTFDCK